MTISNVTSLVWMSIDGGATELFATLTNTIPIAGTPNTFSVAPFGFYAGSTGNIYADGVIVDNLESGYPIQIFIGGLVKTIAPFCRSKFKLDVGIGLVTFSFLSGDDLANTLSNAQTFNLIFYKGRILDAESEELNAVKALSAVSSANNTFLQSGQIAVAGTGTLATVLNPPSLPTGLQLYVENINLVLSDMTSAAAGFVRILIALNDSVSAANVLFATWEFTATAAGQTLTNPFQYAVPFRAKLTRFAGLNANVLVFTNAVVSQAAFTWSFTGTTLP